ncbi:putative transcription factor p65 homolog [Liolophura sinensis]|uniref:putative transcription factor p65 homolog n=1 Tax=Liolophura sinensis TaxID=3198878 RepID=UPI003157FDCA
MAASQDFALPLEDLSKYDSKELEKILQNFGGFDSDVGTSSELNRILEAAAAQTDPESVAPSSSTGPGTYQISPQPAPTTPKPAQGTSSRQRAGAAKQGPARGAHSSMMTGSQAENQSAPYVEIIEQPRTKGLRFRYECEGRSAGSIPGENSTPEKKTYPTIKIHNHTGAAVVVVSCVTKDLPKPRPHPHALVGKDCTKGVCTVRVRDASVIKFPHLGIQCAKKKDVEDHIRTRKEINVDPFQTGFDNPKDIDLNIVRLCFQVFLPGKDGKFTRIVQPVCSNAILDKKAHNELVICRIDHTSGRARGGDEVFLLCEKVNKDDIGVRFYELGEDGTSTWEDYADFGQGDVHRQLAIVFRTPAYRETNISTPVHVFLQLRRPSDQEVSDSIPFTYMPEDPDPHHIEEKRKRKFQKFNSFIQDESPAGRNATVKERIKAKASRKIKQEQADPALPLYNIGNIEGQSQNQTCAVGPPHGAYMGGVPAMSTVSTMNFTSGATTSAATVQVNPQHVSATSSNLGNITMGNLFQQSSGVQAAQLPVVPDLHMSSIPEGQDPNKMNNEFMYPNYTTSNPIITDINFAVPTSSFDLSVLQEYLRDNPANLAEGESTEMASFGLSSDLLTTDYDPGVAAMVSVSSDTMENDLETQRQCEEVHRALSDLK